MEKEMTNEKYLGKSTKKKNTNGKVWINIRKFSYSF